MRLVYSLFYISVMVAPMVAVYFNKLSVCGLFFLEGMIILLLFLDDLKQVLRGRGAKDIEYKRNRITRMVYTADISALCFLVAYCLMGIR